jgi:arylsulfatase A
MCENIDDNVGRLLRRLHALDLSDDTIVLFLTDNGANSDRYDGNMKGRKGSIDEGGVRVPLFVRWPGRIEAGREVKPIAAHVDLFATIMELCGLPMPPTLPQDGMSLVPLLKGQSESWPDRMLYTFRSPRGDSAALRGSVRTQRWRAVKGGRGWELYDMAKDPSQLTNVAKDRRDVVDRLRHAFEAAARDVTRGGFDPIATHVGYPDWPVVTLPGHEAFLEPAGGKGISYLGRSGWANDWITNWTDTQAHAWWPLRVARPGQFEVTLLYVCPEQYVGTRLHVEVGGRALEGAVRQAHDPQPIPSPDRAPRGEVYEKVWMPLRLGVVELSAGETRLVLRVREIVGGRACDIKAVRLRRVG